MNWSTMSTEDLERWVSDNNQGDYFDEWPQRPDGDNAETEADEPSDEDWRLYRDELESMADELARLKAK